MCLLLTGKSKDIRGMYLGSKALVDDVFFNNGDGLGVMFADSGKLRIKKVLPKTAADATKFISELPDDDRELAMHWRMRTHGDIDLSQCHPYKVYDGTWLMHNGILQTGNDADKTKSDTWHFIQDYLQGMPPDVLHNAGTLFFLGEFIGNNRFAIMTNDGRLSVVNREQGIELKGVWFSNTYAWDQDLLVPGSSRKGKSYGTYTGWRGHTGWAGMDDDGYDYPLGGKATPTALTSVPALKSNSYRFLTDKEFYEGYGPDAIDMALEQCDADEFADWLVAAPMPTLKFVFDQYEVRAYANTPDAMLVSSMRKIREALIAKDANKCAAILAEGGPASFETNCSWMAEALMYYCDFNPKPDAPVVGAGEGDVSILDDDAPDDATTLSDATVEAMAEFYAG